jgi:hypothetical protein
MRLGPLYFDTKEVFLLLAALLVGAAYYFGWPLWLFAPEQLLALVVIMLITKGLLPAIHNEAYFILSLFTIFLLIYLPFFQTLVFYFLSFLFFKVARII